MASPVFDSHALRQVTFTKMSVPEFSRDIIKVFKTDVRSPSNICIVEAFVYHDGSYRYARRDIFGAYAMYSALNEGPDPEEFNWNSVL